MSHMFRKLTQMMKPAMVLMVMLALALTGCGTQDNPLESISSSDLTTAQVAIAGDNFAPEFIAPLVAYLVSEESELTHEIFNVGAGRYSRVFVASTSGWKAEEGVHPSLEEIRDQIAAIRATEEFSIPGNAAEA